MRHETRERAEILDQTNISHTHTHTDLEVQHNSMCHVTLQPKNKGKSF